MRITRLGISNFRSIKDLDLELNETAVLIGPNNAGKTAILDAVRIVLTRRWGQHGTGFTEYDVHLADEDADPKAPPGVSIEIRVEEQQAGEWPEALQQDLDEIVQTDPVTGKTFIILRASCAWNEAAGSFEPSWIFLNAGRAPLVGGSARRMLEYDRAAETLTVHGKLDEQRYRDALTCYGTHADRAVIHSVLRNLRDRALLFIGDEELRALETFARRIRGEIFFARRWFIVEGQAEYLLVHAIARELGYDLDEHGVAVIDAQNNGNPAIFAALARALAIPWLAVFDGDGAGHGYCQSIEARAFEAAFVATRCRTLAAGDLEAQLVADGLEPELKTALTNIGVAGAAAADQAALLGYLRGHKTAYSAELATLLRGNAALAGRMPKAFRDAIADLRGLA